MGVPTCDVTLGVFELRTSNEDAPDQHLGLVAIGCLAHKLAELCQGRQPNQSVLWCLATLT